MNILDIEKFSKNIDGSIFFDFDIKKLNWFNIGGKTKIFYKPSSLNELINFLKIYSNRSKLFILGAGSNVLINDEIFDGAIIKLTKSFSKISVLNDNLLIAGSATSQKKLSDFAKDNNLSGLEFMSCIPGTVGGGIRMNSGCFGKEFKDVLVSVQFIDKNNIVRSLSADKIDFGYRKTDLPKDVIFLSATFKCFNKNKNEIEDQINKLKIKKETSQPSKIKTGGSTFKNPIEQSKKKVWELIKESIPKKISFGDAHISEKHYNFFVNQKNATFEDMNSLIKFVKDKVKEKTGINIELEIVIVE